MTAQVYNRLTVLSGCGYVGIRRSHWSAYSDHYESEDQWFDLVTARRVGNARVSLETAGQTICEGRLPPSDCTFVECDPCVVPEDGQSRENMQCEIDRGAVVLRGRP
jgi:hypothetical protein